MEDGIALSVTNDAGETEVRLNPYYSGRWSRTAITLDKPVKGYVS